MPKHEIIPVKVRRWKESDIPAIVECQRACYPDFALADLCDERNYLLQLNMFPEGQFLAEIQGRVVGYTTTLIVTLEEDTYYSYAEITGTGTFSTHNPFGDTLYGADIAVLPELRGKGIAGKLYAARKKLLHRLNLRRMVAGGRIPGYSQYAGRLTAEEYVRSVIHSELTDPTLTPQIRSGYQVKGVYMDYLSDEKSLNYATFLEYLNPHFDSLRHKISASPIKGTVRKIRVCAVQYQMRTLKSKDDFARQVEFFVNSADLYGCHFLVFPELFTAQLFSLMDPDISGPSAISALCDFTAEYVEMFRHHAQKTGMFIVGGSHPVRDPDKKVRNRAHLFTPQGDVFTQDKLHVTPVEAEHWGIAPGDGLRIFDTGLARIAIQVCYDIEFPEVSRLLTMAGVEVIFVPFSTDDRKAYCRVRHCAQARSVENYIYTVLSGNIGNLPQVRSFLLNYGQAAILTPCDYPFPKDGVLAEASPSDETVVISELDLGDLSKQREIGSVRPLRDRRVDIYTLNSKMPIETVKTYEKLSLRSRNR